ncbi:hypothetical protein PENSPDRAFT_722593, partial [Peniophora sp. CONT]
VNNQSSVAPNIVASPEDAFGQLWSEALRKSERTTINQPFMWRTLLKRMDRCSSAEDVCRVIDDTMEEFQRFRGSDTSWGKLRNHYLKPAIKVLLSFNDAIAETAASFPNVPGGKAIFVAFGVLLQATQGVSAYCEALITLFEELNLFLESLRPRLQVPSSLGSASKTIAITILAHLLDILVHATNILSKRPWLGRLGLYGRALLKDTTMQEALSRLRALTDLEVRAMTGEISMNTSQLLSELQTLNQGRSIYLGVLAFGGQSVLNSALYCSHCIRQREYREKVDASRIFDRLGPVSRADIDSQSPEGCMNGTRVKLLKDLNSWSHERNAPRIYWLNGMAGTGKSAVARSFCKKLQRDNLLGGSFFCSRGGSVEEGDVQRIIPTLAASLATHDATFNRRLLAELHGQPFSVHWNLALQIERLLMRPLSSIERNSSMRVLVIDALDECFDEAATGDLLLRLVKVTRVLPVKFFLTSRPEPHIRQQLDDLDPPLTVVLRLHDIEQDVVKADISLYVAHGLRKMREPHFPHKWPLKEDISTLTRLSGKLFIYAFTALQYLRKDPMGRLPNLTGKTVTAGRPLTQPLDDIYNLILSESMDRFQYETEEIDLTRRVLATIVALREPITVESLGKLLRITPSQLRMSLARLHAVIYVPVRDDSGVLSTFHASFSDFLTQLPRTPESLVPYITKRHTRLATACIEMLQSDDLHFNLSQATSSYVPNTEQKLAHIHGGMRYSCLNWSSHFTTAVFREAPNRSLSRMLCRLIIGPRFLFWLEALSTLGMMEQAINILRHFRSDVDYAWKGIPIIPPRLFTFMAAALDFVIYFCPALSQSAPHIYISALYLCDKGSIISKCCFPYFLKRSISVLHHEIFGNDK